MILIACGFIALVTALLQAEQAQKGKPR